MSYQEKQSLVAIISNLISSTIYFYYRLQGIDLNAPLDVKFWASTILFYLLVLIVSRIIIYIIFSILNTIITREEEPKFTDEMDKLIDTRATVNFYHLFTLGIFLAISTALLDFPPASIFIGILASMFIAGLILELSRLYFYRKGVF
jgi:hypothetical protein